MKITFVLLLATFMSVSASTLAQKITLNTTNANLKTVLKDIKKQTGYSFIIDEQLLDNAKTVTLHLNNTNLSTALDKLFESQPLTYTIEDKVVTIKEKQPSLLDKLKSALNLDKIDVRGRVVEENSQPLAGATVTVKGTDNSTTTDANGVFNLKNVSPNMTIVVSFVGYDKRELNAVPDFGTIKMIASSNALDQVQVIAYGQTTERLTTGDISVVKSSDIEYQPVSNPLLDIEGRVPGIFIKQNTGTVNGAVGVQLRGKNSLLQGTTPFYVIDGVPYASGGLLPNLAESTSAEGGAGDPLAYLNPNDIESIEILKDADATSIYGSRAANGAILITTKKGKAGKTKFAANLNSGVETAPNVTDYVNTTQYLQLRHQAFKNDGVTPTTTNAPDLLVFDTTQYTNWRKLLVGGTARYNDGQGSLSGGNSNTQYLLSGNFHSETPVFGGSSSTDQKSSAHLNINNTSDNQRFKLVFTGNYMYSYTDLPTADPSTELRYMIPDAPDAYNSDGTLNWANGKWPNSSNPLAYSLRRFVNRTKNLVTSTTLSYELFKNLLVKSTFGYNDMEINEVATTPLSSLNPATAPVSGAGYTTNSINSWIVEPQATYKFTIGRHQIDVLAGGTFQQSNSLGQILQGSGYASDALLENIQAANMVNVQSVTNILYRYDAAFGRLNYNFLDKYLISVNWRRDGSSRFGPDKQFHDFESLGGAWIFSEEDYIKNTLPFLSFGKIHSSYGTTGNDQIGDYAFYNLYKTTSYPYQGTTALAPQNFYNPEVAWETTKKFEIGMELGFFKDRILLNASYYNNHSSDELLNYALPLFTGFGSILSNFPATVQNTGWEFTLNTQIVKSKTFSWNTSFNITAPQNRLLSFPNLANSTYKYALVIGQPINIIKAYHLIGVNAETGVYQFADKSGDPTYTPSPLTDKTALVNLNPKFYGGLGNTIRYKDFELDFLLQFIKQTGYNPSFFLSAPGFELNTSVLALNSWQQPGDKAPFERLTQKYGSAAYNAYSYAVQSDYNFVDASYIRLKNLSFSYAIPYKWIKALSVQSCKIFVRGENLLTFTKYKGADPETQNINNLPPLRVLTGGVQLFFQ